MLIRLVMNTDQADCTHREDKVEGKPSQHYHVVQEQLKPAAFEEIHV